MKKQYYLFLLLLASSTVFVFDSCKKKSNDDNTDGRDKFVAVYGVTENGTDFTGTPYTNYTFDITVTKSSSVSSDILISNFGDFGATVKATVTGNNITIPQQTQTIAGAASGISGSGSLSGTTLTFDYHVSQGSAGADAHDIAVKK
jgi:hypothetical protein